MPKDDFRFNPDRIAYLEATGWRAYYDRDWVKLLRLVVELCQEQFRIPFPVSLFAAYYVTRAAAAWAPIDHDAKKVLHYYERFYRIAARHSGLAFDPARVAELELRYNDDHRRLVGKEDKTEFIQTMVELHSVVFDITPEAAQESAERRVQANNVVDRITGKLSTDPESDWRLIEDELRACYRSIQAALGAKE